MSRPARAGLPIAVAGFAAGLIISVITSQIAAAATGYELSSAGAIPIGVTAADVIGLWIGLVGAALWYSRTAGTSSLSQDLGLRVGTWWDLPVGAAIGLACQYGLIPLLYLPFKHFDRHLSHQLSQPAQRDTSDAHSWAAVIVLLIVLAIGAPLVEELFFRGLLLRSLSAWVTPAVAIIADGLLFGLAHFEAVQFAGLAVFGMVLALIAWRLRRLGPTIAAHASFNAAAVIASSHLH